MTGPEAFSLPGHDRDCAVAIHNQALRFRASTPLDEIQVMHLLAIGFRAGRDAGHRDGRAEAARMVEAHADEFAPRDGNAAQRRMRRHLLIAARVAAPEPTMAEIVEALAAGNYAACYVDEAGRLSAATPAGDPAGADPEPTR